MADPTLSVTYASPTSQPFSITHTVPAPATHSVDDKTQHLVALRAAVSAAQDTINKELTARMEEDKARDAAAASSKPAAAKGVDEEKEEENYGEEMQEEED